MLQVAQGLKLLLISLALSFVVGLIAGVFGAWIKTARHHNAIDLITMAVAATALISILGLCADGLTIFGASRCKKTEFRFAKPPIELAFWQRSGFFFAICHPSLYSLLLSNNTNPQGMRCCGWNLLLV